MVEKIADKEVQTVLEKADQIELLALDPLYLHGTGAIGDDGPASGITVTLSTALARFDLPAPPEGKALVDALQASLRFLDLGPDRITFPLLAAVYRAVLGPCDFGLHIAGPTGVFKTEAAALIQQHYGRGLDARHVPGSWSSTGNSLEALAFAAKDSVILVDDFAPTGSTGDVQRYHREADRLFRAQGNAAGRQRMRPDATLRPAKPPRGLILSTGEDVPRGQSLRARLLVLEVSAGDIDLAHLTACQRDASSGLYAEAMAGFVRWLAPRYREISAGLQAEVAAVRAKSQARTAHARTPGIVADLAVGLEYFFTFALNSGAITANDKEELIGRTWRALCDAADAQIDLIEAAEPAGHFLRLLAGALASGRAHVSAPAGDEPESPSAWGWREIEIGTGANARGHWQAQGRRIGWLDGTDLYLEPEAAYAEAQELARHQGESLAVTARTLWRRLRERDYLASWDVARKRQSVRRSLGGQRREVIHLPATIISHVELSQPSQSPADPANTG